MILPMKLFTGSLFRLGLLGGLLGAPAGARAARAVPPLVGTDLVPSLLKEGEQRFRAGRYTEAERSLNTALQLDPKSAQAEKLLAQCCTALGDHGGAREHYKRYLRLASPRDPEYAAIEQRVSSMEAVPRSPAAPPAAPGAPQAKPTPAAAAAAAQAQRELDPDAAAQQDLRDARALQAQEPEAALAKLDEAIRLDERSAEAFVLRAQLCARLDRLQEGRADLRRARALKPDGALYYNLDTRLQGSDEGK